LSVINSEEGIMQGMKVQALSMLSLGLFAAMINAQGRPAQGGTPELTYFGRASVKIKTTTGYVIYIDPYAPGDYSEPADLVLVTHGHSDHNQVKLTTRKSGAVVASPAGAVSSSGARVVAEGSKLELDSGKLSVEALPAANKNHDRKECVGFLLSFDGIVLYHAGDTDYLPEMEGYAKYNIDYALLPCDGFYNMGSAQAARCAKAMKAKRVVPIHSDKAGLFNEKNARAVGDSLVFSELVLLKPGETTTLAQ
jgi:L-ascorbate metabolism protein UlaG (beta-lactamase superfamily)